MSGYGNPVGNVYLGRRFTATEKLAAKLCTDNFLIWLATLKAEHDARPSEENQVDMYNRLFAGTPKPID